MLYLRHNLQQVHTRKLMRCGIENKHRRFWTQTAETLGVLDQNVFIVRFNCFHAEGGSNIKPHKTTSFNVQIMFNFLHAECDFSQQNLETTIINVGII